MGSALNDWVNGRCVDVFVTNVVSLHMLSVILVLWGVGLTLENGVEFKNKIILHCYTEK